MKDFTLPKLSEPTQIPKINKEFNITVLPCAKLSDTINQKAMLQIPTRYIQFEMINGNGSNTVSNVVLVQHRNESTPMKSIIRYWNNNKHLSLSLVFEIYKLLSV